MAGSRIGSEVKVIQQTLRYLRKIRMPMRIVLNVHESMVDSAVEKKAVAAWVSSQTLASSEWLAEALHMGHRSSISKAKK